MSLKKDLSIDFLGVKCENPFFLSSSPVGSNYEMCAKALEAGWGGIYYKTIGIFIPDECSPRFDITTKEGTPWVGFKNMEQISDKPLEVNLEYMRRLKQDYPNKVIVASIMGSNDEEWTTLAKAVTGHCKTNGIELSPAESYTETAGGGISAVVEGRNVLIGNKRLMDNSGVDISMVEETAHAHADNGEIPLYVAIDNKLAGILFIADKIKETSAEAIEGFKKAGIETVMLTGDNEKTARAIQKKLGISQVRSQLMPEDKATIIKELQEQGKKVAMIGDGINDAPALTTADVGIAIGAGQDIAIESADIVLMKSDLNDAVTAVKLSRSVMKNIKENLFWALIYNSLGIPLAAGVFYGLLGWKLNPMFGAAAMSLSSVCVVTNALRLNLFKSGRENKAAKAEINTKTEDGKMKKVMKIDGMMCSHCTGTVTKVLNAIDGVTADVSLEDKCAYITLDKDVADEVLSKAVTDAGYKVKGIK